MKADLVSLFLVEALHTKGYYTDAQRRAVYASGIRRVLKLREPRRSQAYATMQLMQFNWFLEFIESWAAQGLGIIIPKPNEHIIPEDTR